MQGYLCMCGGRADKGDKLWPPKLSRGLCHIKSSRRRDAKFEFLSLSLSLYLSMYIHQFIHLPIYLSICFLIHRSPSPSICQHNFLSLSLSLSLYVIIYQSICFLIYGYLPYLSICFLMFLCAFTSISIPLYNYPSIYLYASLSLGISPSSSSTDT